jgi:hypothetical protein
MLIPGAGRGHDAREFARHGFEVVAVDFASDAVRDMQAALTPATKHEILHQDFFALDPALDHTFDYILEYTCYCAIDPNRRVEYADKIVALLKPQGLYIALLFPIGATPPSLKQGPPFTVNPDELIARLEARGLRLLHRESPPDSVKPRKGREELVILQKP